MHRDHGDFSLYLGDVPAMPKDSPGILHEGQGEGGDARDRTAECNHVVILSSIKCEVSSNVP